MPLAKSIFPNWYVLANSMHSTKINMLIRDILIMTSAIIISTMDIQGVRTNNVGDITTGRKPARRGRVNPIGSSSVSEAHEDRR